MSSKVTQPASTKRQSPVEMSTMLGAIWIFSTGRLLARLENVKYQYSEAAARFYQFGEEVGLDLSEIHGRAARLIIREGKFLSHPTQYEHDDLNRQWHGLTESMIRLMEDTNVTPDRNRLRGFAMQVSAFRDNIIRN